MNRRHLINAAVAGAAGSGAAALALTQAFKPESKPPKTPRRLEPETAESRWKYEKLSPDQTTALAYEHYPQGSCMYGVVKSIVSQLADQFGEPFASFPCHMMKYGHGGIAGYGTVCGALNGGAAVFGLLVTDKEDRDALIADLFRWYEQTPLPSLKPEDPGFDFEAVSVAAGSPLCHASITNWSDGADVHASSKERKERCRRLAADVAGKVTAMLNDYFADAYTAPQFNDETVQTCMTCHGKEGKLDNTAGQMSCTSCHSESIGHRLFGDVHYKLMKDEK